MGPESEHPHQPYCIWVRSFARLSHQSARRSPSAFEAAKLPHSIADIVAEAEFAALDDAVLIGNRVNTMGAPNWRSSIR